MKLFILIPFLVSAPVASESPSSVPRLRFMPTEPIRADVVDRLETVLFWEAGRPTLAQKLQSDPAKLIDDVGISGHQNRLYWNPYYWKGRSEEASVGIYAYDLRTGRLTTKTRVPAGQDGTGEEVAVTKYTRTIYDFPAGNAYLSNVLRDGSRCVWKLSLTKDEPDLLAYAPFVPDAEGPRDPRLQRPRDLVRYPVLGPTTLLLWGGMDTYEHYTATFFDTAKAEMDGPYPLPTLQEGTWRMMAGSGAYIVARGPDRAGSAVLQAREGEVVPAGQAASPSLTFNRSNVLDGAQRRDLAKDLGSKQTQQNPVQVYEVPSMRVMARLPGEANGPFVVIPNTNVMATLPYDDQRAIRFFDLTSHAQIGEVRLGAPAFIGEWRELVCDEAGLYIGAFCLYRVQLFAVRPMPKN